jgi:hypothetical protein
VGTGYQSTLNMVRGQLVEGRGTRCQSERRGSVCQKLTCSENTRNVANVTAASSHLPAAAMMPALLIADVHPVDPAMSRRFHIGPDF